MEQLPDFDNGFNFLFNHYNYLELLPDMCNLKTITLQLGNIQEQIMKRDDIMRIELTHSIKRNNVKNNLPRLYGFSIYSWTASWQI